MEQQEREFPVVRKHSSAHALSELWRHVSESEGNGEQRFIKAPVLILESYVIRDPEPKVSFRQHLHTPVYSTSMRTTIGYIQNILIAIEFLHSVYITHGAVKPENILITGNIAQLTDLGISVDRKSDDTVALAQCAFEGACHKCALDSYSKIYNTNEIDTGETFWVWFIHQHRKLNDISDRFAQMLLNCDYIVKKDIGVVCDAVIANHSSDTV